MNLQTQNSALIRNFNLKTCMAVVMLLMLSNQINAAEPGLTPSEFSVGASGAAQYSIPIAVPPGTAGMAPSLSLNYSSQGGNGVLGVGWSLGGLSAISRCPQTIAQDGAIRGVKFDSGDKACLDGQRLVVTNGGNYGWQGTEYHTEIDSFSLITSDGSAGSGNGPASFTVRTKSGQIMTYGGTTNSQIEASGLSVISTWAVSRIEDTVGNYIDFTYTEDSGHYRIAHINYTGNLTTSTAPYSGVYFTYADRNDQISTYYMGKESKQKKILTSIKTVFGPTGVLKEYKLNYENSGPSQRSRLTSVEECTAGNKCFKPTTFDWTDFGPGTYQHFQYTDHVQGNGTDYKSQLADLDSDGLNDDLISLAVNASGLHAVTAMGNGGGTFKGFKYAKVVPGNLTAHIAPQLGDINGDGKPDILSLTAVSSGIHAVFAYGNGDGTFSPYFEYELIDSGNYTGFQAQQGDINGDGMTDVIAVAVAETGFHSAVALGKGDGTFHPIKYKLHRNLDFRPYDVHLADFNGDGLTDISAIATAGAGLISYVALSNGDGTFQSVIGHAQTNINYSPYDSHIGDFNGDGLADITAIATASVGLISYVAIGKGDGHFMPVVGTLLDNTKSFDPYDSHVGDFNADGLSDIATIATAGSGLISYTALGKGDGSFAPHVGIAHDNGNFSNYKNHIRDINGDGLPDVVAINTGPNGIQTVTAVANGNQPDRISSITNSLDSVTNITYKPLTDVAVYTKESTSVYPELDITAPMQVVYSVLTDNGIGSQNETQYGYKGAKAHLKGRGFLGFREMYSTDVVTGIKTTTLYRQDYPYIGQVERTTTAQFDGKLITGTLNTHDKIDYANDRVFPYVDLSSTFEYDIDGSLIKGTYTNYDYDLFGNPEKIHVQVRDGNSQTFTENFHTITNNTYTNQDALGRYFLGRLTRSEVTKINANGDSPPPRVSSFEYNLGTNGLLDKEIIEPDKPEFMLSTQYEYDDYGNKIKVTVSGGSGETQIVPRITESDYITNALVPGQFPIKVTNALGQSETHKYDSRFGVMTELVGPNGLPTTWEYDDFGRQEKENRADGTDTTITRGWCTNNCALYGKLIKNTQVSGNAGNAEVSDTLGRVITTNGFNRTSSSSYAGAQILNRTEYNNRGEVKRQSQPHFADTVDANIPWTSFIYDDLGRLKSESDSQGTTFYNYNGLNTTVTNRKSQSTTRYTNARGELVQVDDAYGNVTSYVYDAYGNQVEVEDSGEVDGPSTNITRLTYDIRGRKTQMTDPDMGVWTYKYNALGELISQTDAKTQTTTMEYDILGRMTKRLESEGTSFWVYGSDTNASESGSNAIGKLVYTQRCDNEEIYNKYDNFGRPESVKTVLFGKEYTTSTTYDSYSRVDTITYPKSDANQLDLVVTNHYDSHGYLDRVSGPSNLTYWQAIDQNARGQVTAFSLGNGKTTTKREYDVLRGLVGNIKTGNSQSTTNIQNLTFTFDSIGNLTNRTGYDQAESNALSEVFTYDSLNRLKTSTVSGQSTKAYTYDSIGNLMSKPDVGNYTYGENGAGPHAVTSTTVGNKTYQYDLNGNLIEAKSNGSITRTMTWSPYNKPTEITDNGNTVSFVYGANRNRIRQINSDKAIYYVGGLFEAQRDLGTDVWTDVHYIKAGGSTVAIVKSFDDQQATETRYVHKDHLGGIEAITDEMGTLVQQLSYDPHGKRRASDWTDAAQVTSSFTPRGFTGHEHLDEVGLIHMNGRVYDPTLGRFMSADPFVQFPESGQSLNRYSYVMNNPLSFSDPSGFGLFSFFKKLFKSKIFRFVASAVLAYVTYGAVSGAVWSSALAGGPITAAAAATTALNAAVLGGAAAGFAGGFVGSGGNLSAALQGAVVGGLSGGIGQAGGALTSRTAKAIAHGAVGGAQAAVNGGKFLRGFASSFFTKQVSGGIAGKFRDNPVGGAIAAATVGGTASVLGGGKFGNGAQTSAFQYLFNEAVGKGSKNKKSNTKKSELDAENTYKVPENIRNALERTFNEPNTEGIDVIYNPAFVWRHLFGALGSVTRPGVIYTNLTAKSFFANDFHVLHEYYHVIEQWRNQGMTIIGYLSDSSTKEAAANGFAGSNLSRYKSLK